MFLESTTIEHLTLGLSLAGMVFSHDTKEMSLEDFALVAVIGKGSFGKVGGGGLGCWPCCDPPLFQGVQGLPEEHGQSICIEDSAEAETGPNEAGVASDEGFFAVDLF